MRRVPGTAFPEPRCRIASDAARECHRTRVHTRCNFAQTQIRVEARSVVYRLGRPTLRGPVDEGDELRCPGFSPEEPRRSARCTGRAGRGVRVGMYLETRRLACEGPPTVRVSGGPDCAPDVVCPAIAFTVKRDLEPVGGCGP